MTEKPIMHPNHYLYALINSAMDKCEPNALMRVLFEQAYVKEGYRLDWNKRLDNNGEWKDKGDVE